MQGLHRVLVLLEALEARHAHRAHARAGQRGAHEAAGGLPHRVGEHVCCGVSGKDDRDREEFVSGTERSVFVW